MLGYFFAISLASEKGRSIPQYLDTAVITRGKQIFSSFKLVVKERG